MRVAAIYDIHGNLPALEAVLADIRAEAVDEIVVGGDVVPGPMPRECLELLADVEVPIHFIHGNGESDILALHRGEPMIRVPAQFHEVMRWVAEALTPEQVVDFATWPITRAAEIPGVGSVLFCHATPEDENRIFTRITPEAPLRMLFDPLAVDVLVCGHTHMQFDRRIGPTRVVNAGSVGMPFADPGAYWVLLGEDVSLRRTEYDLAAADVRIRAAGYPETAGLDILNPPPAEHMERLFEDAALK